jgi:hypothetical protein
MRWCFVGRRWFAKWIPVLAVLLLGVLWGGQRFWNRDDPYWQGKRLSHWLRTTDEADGEKTYKAVQELGTNCTPLLLRWLRKNERDYVAPGYVLTMNDWLGKQKVVKLRFPTELAPGRTQVALRVFRELGPCGKAGIPGLMGLLENEESEVAANAFSLLSEMQPEFTEALVERLSHREPRARVTAIRALAAFGSSAWGTIPLIRRALSDADPNVRAAAVDALVELGMDPKVDAPVFRRMLNEKSVNVRLAAVCALMKLGDDPEPIVPALLQIIQEGDPELRGLASGRLASLGERARPAIPQLKAILTNMTQADVRRDVDWTIRMIGLKAFPGTTPAKPDSASAAEPR